MLQPKTVKRRNTGRWEWREGNKLHRTDGPAVEWDDESKEWYEQGDLHRLDGPAIDYPRVGLPYKEWWINGVEYNCLEWMLKVHELEQA